MVAVRKWVEAEWEQQVAEEPLLDAGELAARLEDRRAAPWEKREALAALGALGGPEATQALLRYLAEPDPGLELAAQAALEQVMESGVGDRNSACPCGSGAKWKHCCARDQFDWSTTRRTRKVDRDAPWRR